MLSIFPAQINIYILQIIPRNSNINAGNLHNDIIELNIKKVT